MQEVVPQSIRCIVGFQNFNLAMSLLCYTLLFSTLHSFTLLYFYFCRYYLYGQTPRLPRACWPAFFV